jgi:L-amino acid N-acyltransferase YncA
MPARRDDDGGAKPNIQRLARNHPPGRHTAVSCIVRDSSPDDVVEIHSIYCHHVLHGTASFEEVPPSVDELTRRRAGVIADGLPYLVAELDSRIAGYAYASSYHQRCAYRFTIEDSVYVDHRLARRGIGHALLSALIARCEAGDWRQMIAVIGDSGNAASIALHQRCGFVHAGALRAVGFKLGRWIDTVLMQRALGFQ